MSMKRFARWYVIVPIALVGTPLLFALIGEVVSLLWNALLPSLFGWPRITLWQGLGLFVLCKLLFGGLGSGGGGGHHRKGMTPQERERLRRRMCETTSATDASPPNVP